MDVDRSLLTLPVGSELNAAMDLLNREPGPRYVPGRSIPLPASVSDSFRETIAMPYRASEWMLTPADAAGWRDAVATLAKESTPFVLKIVEKLGVTYRHTTIDGVSAYEVSPKEIAPRHANRLVVDTHGGGYVFNPGEACLLEPAVIAATCGIKVLAVDYRMPPDHPFPAALDDAVAVWKAVISARPVSQVARAGGSAGGGLALATVLRVDDGLMIEAATGLGERLRDHLEHYHIREQVELIDASADLFGGGGLVAVKHALFTGTQTASVSTGADFAITDLSITHTLADSSNKLII
ncbi:MAG: alpha/beta hydrolase fold domain-containing protein, partial [Phycisphaerales bacterium]